MGRPAEALRGHVAQYGQALLDGDVAGEQALVGGPFGLPPQGLGDRGHQVRGRGDRDGAGRPGRAVEGVAEEEQETGDRDLRADVDGHVADAGGADLAGRGDVPDDRLVRGRDGGHHLRGGEQAPLPRC